MKCTAFFDSTWFSRIYKDFKFCHIHKFISIKQSDWTEWVSCNPKKKHSVEQRPLVNCCKHIFLYAYGVWTVSAIKQNVRSNVINNAK